MSEVHLCLFKSGTYVVQFRYGRFFVECRWPQAVLMAYISSNVRLETSKTLLKLLMTKNQRAHTVRLDLNC